MDWGSESGRDFLKYEDCRIANAPLDATNIGSMQAGFEGKLLLRPADILAISLHIEPDPAPDIHGARGPFCRFLVYRL